LRQKHWNCKNPKNLHHNLKKKLLPERKSSVSRILAQLCLYVKYSKQKAQKGRIGAVSGIISRPALGPFVALAAIGLGSANGRRAVHLFRLNNQKSQAQRAVFIENSRIYDENARIYFSFHEQRKQRNSRTFHLENLLGQTTQKTRKGRKTRFPSKNHKNLATHKKKKETKLKEKKRPGRILKILEEGNSEINGAVNDRWTRWLRISSSMAQ
jgi:hypothetical protein